MRLFCWFQTAKGRADSAMEQYLMDLVEWTRAQPLLGIFAILLFISFMENVFPPIPGDLLIVFGGYLASEQVVGFSLVVVSTTLGSVLGFMTLYYFGYIAGDEIRTKKNRLWFLRFFNVAYIDKAERWMYRWGQGVVLANRFLAGARTLISIMAGVTKLNIRKTVFYATMGALIWNLLLIGLGWFIGDNWPIIKNYLNYYGTIIASVLAIFVIYRLAIYLLLKKRKNSTG